MTTLLITHPACLDHLVPSGHPERPDRLRPLETVALCHPMDYIVALRDASPKEGLVHLDGDTAMSAGTYEAALRAAGGGIRAVDEVLAGRARAAIVDFDVHHGNGWQEIFWAD